MTFDLLSDLLRAVRLRGAVFYDVEASPPWVAEAPPSRVLLPEVMPRAEHLIEFHAVVRGSCWAARVGDSAVRLTEGDVVLFPRGDAHVVSSAPGMRATVAPAAANAAPPSQRRPYALRVDATGESRPRGDDGPAGATRVICGFLGMDATPFNPLLASLPPVLSIGGLAASGTWTGALLGTAVQATARRSPGGEALLERISEILFLDALRRYAGEVAPEQTGWLAGMRDPVVGAALAALHREPAATWTLERLGEVTRASRSTLHERFTHYLGTAPMQYLAQWRMQLATHLLRDAGAKIVRVALEVGYESEAAFSRAFKRIVGKTPGAWRRDIAASGFSA